MLHHTTPAYAQAKCQASDDPPSNRRTSFTTACSAQEDARKRQSPDRLSLDEEPFVDPEHRYWSRDHWKHCGG
jgi:hypothetical protein